MCVLSVGRLWSLHMRLNRHLFLFFFFNDTATTEIYTLSLHDALPISAGRDALGCLLDRGLGAPPQNENGPSGLGDRKSTRLNSSHANISYAVFCLKKKKKKNQVTLTTNERC